MIKKHRIHSRIAVLNLLKLKGKKIKSKHNCRKMATTQSFEDLEAKYETKETSESVILVVHIPDGSFGLLTAPFLLLALIF